MKEKKPIRNTEHASRFALNPLFIGHYIEF